MASMLAQKELKRTEIELRNLSRRIDNVLRRHHANSALRKYLSQNTNKTNIPWVGLFAFFFVFVIMIKIHWTVALAQGVIAFWLVQDKLMPRIYFMGYTFKLMRLERYDKDEELYIEAPFEGDPSGFGKTNWRNVHKVEDGRFLVSVYDRDSKRIAIVHLCNVGLMSVTLLQHGLFKQYALPQISAEEKQFVEEFDVACDKYLDIAIELESRRTLKFEKNVPQPKNMEEAGQGVVIVPDADILVHETGAFREQKSSQIGNNAERDDGVQPDVALTNLLTELGNT